MCAIYYLVVVFVSIQLTHGDNTRTCDDNPKYGEKCAKWVAEGECETNPNWMPFYCQKSCDKCDQCIDDVRYSKSCEKWSGEGECDKNADWMKYHCMKSCDNCPKQSDPNKLPCQYENEERSSGCGYECTCAQVQSGKCSEMCAMPFPGGPTPCFCKSGYFFDNDARRCRLMSECQKTNACGNTECGRCERCEYDETGSQLCVHSHTICPSITPPQNPCDRVMCEQGKICVPLGEPCYQQPCIWRTCKDISCGVENQERSGCGKRCTCNEIQNDNCPLMCARPAPGFPLPCFCKQGYFYDEDKQRCRAVHECEQDAKCELENQQRTPCFKECTCAEVATGQCHRQCHGTTPAPGRTLPCHCQDNYFYDKSQQRCRLMTECAEPSNCPLANQERKQCGYACTCSQVKAGKCDNKFCSMTITSRPGDALLCLCKEGYFYDGENNQCRLFSECQPETASCPLANQERKLCGRTCTCSEVGTGQCGSQVCAMGQPGIDPPCLCKEGYFYDSDKNRCRLFAECEKPTDCSNIVCGRCSQCVVMGPGDVRCLRTPCAAPISPPEDACKNVNCGRNKKCVATYQECFQPPCEWHYCEDTTEAYCDRQQCDRVSDCPGRCNACIEACGRRRCIPAICEPIRPFLPGPRSSA